MNLFPDGTRPDPDNPAPLLLVGDSHGDTRFLEAAADTAVEAGCAGIVQLGDFGFWPTRFGDLDRMWLETVDRAVASRGLWMRVIDGNHDAHQLARDAFPAEEQIRQWGEVCDWADRGAVWSWWGTRYGALGGAVSVDKEYRRVGVSWWPTEDTEPEDVQRLVEAAGGEPLDVLFTHDAPVTALVPDRFKMSLPGHIHRRCEHNSGLILEAVHATTPKVLYHGHFHGRYQATLPLGGDTAVRIEGVAANVTHSGNMLVHDPAAWRQP